MTNTLDMELGCIDYWTYAIIAYSFSATISFVRTISAILSKVKLNPDGNGYDQSPHFSDNEKDRLRQHYTRIAGTLGFWKNQAEKYKRAKNYCISWTIIISIIVPILSQLIGEGNSNWFLTIVSTHGALILAFYRGFKVENNYQAFRLVESEFYDLRRELLDSPRNLGETSEKQIENFFKRVQDIRSSARQAEIDNTPTIDTQKS